MAEQPKLDTIEAQETYRQAFTPLKDIEGSPSVYTTETHRQSIYAEKAAMESAPYSNWETFKHAGKLMWEDTTFGVMQRHADISNARHADESTNPLLTAEEANEQYSKYGVKFGEPIRQKEAEVIASKKIKEMALKQSLQQTEGNFLSGASSLLGSFAGAMLDPINIATSFIPVSKLIPAVKGLEAMGFMGQVASKGLDGMIMNSLVEPLPLWMAGIDQRDYTMADSLFNVVAGGVFGAGIGALSEGIRVLGNGEKFNSNLASAIDFGNNRGLDNVREFQNRKNPISSIAYDDLVALPDTKLSIAEENGLVTVKINDVGELSNISGYGKTIEEAKTNLRQQLTVIIGDDTIYKGYRLDDGIDNLFKAVRETEGISTYRWMPAWIDKLEQRAVKAGMSLEDFLATQTKGFTDFSKLQKEWKKAQKKQAINKKFKSQAFDEISSEELDELIEQSAGELDALAKLKEAINRNPRQVMTSDIALGDLRENLATSEDLYNKYNRANTTLANHQAELENLMKQLDVTEDTIAKRNLESKISRLKALIKAQQEAINIFLRKYDINTWEKRKEGLTNLESLKERLSTDNRDFGDIVEQLTKQADNDGSWDTNLENSLDIGENLGEDLAPDVRISQFEQDIISDIETIKNALVNKDIEKSVMKGLDIDADGYTSEMRNADKILEQVDQFNKDIEAFLDCRKTEV